MPLLTCSGVGLADFRHEKPWRPPSLLLEADPPRHDAPRRVLREILAPPALRRLRAAWQAVAEELVEQVLTGGTELDAFTALAEAFPLRAFPDAVGLGPDGRENLLPYGNMAFNAFGPRNDLVAADAHRVAELSAWVNAQCAREALSEDGFGARIWAAADRGDLTYEQAPLVVRSLLAAGVDTTVHGLAACLYAFATHPEEWQRLRERPELARTAFDEAVRWQSPVFLPYRHHRRHDRRHGRPGGHEDPHAPRRGQPRPGPLARPRPLRPHPRPLRSCRLRHGPPPVHRPARGPPGGRGDPDRPGPPRRAHRTHRHTAPPPQRAATIPPVRTGSPWSATA
ncbi:Cytochrome P450 OS=Streptomyces aurantiogriseus OX=66870 GN=GCM10010251_57750 PE=3 SV=1 [Streptomyces aurantiogriseus]|uniref:Cytochrome P450 n=1 Tax=Streptomyces aurantiogriseus TaxID=66870 RepID=A0A918FDS9_9ACTN|nr:hypothetical protein GCM10010251_57750 [Streptomyces aurantiogriseus]